MTFTATVHRVMIASPGDVQVERDLVRDVVHEWNSLHGAREKTMLLPVGWETDVAPEMGDAPQSIINKRLLGPPPMVTSPLQVGPVVAIPQQDVPHVCYVWRIAMCCISNVVCWDNC